MGGGAGESDFHDDAAARPLRLAICPDGVYRMTLGGATLHLSEDELAALGRAIHVMAGRHPTLLGKLIAAAVEDDRGGDRTTRESP